MSLSLLYPSCVQQCINYSYYCSLLLRSQQGKGRAFCFFQKWSPSTTLSTGLSLFLPILPEICIPLSNRFDVSVGLRDQGKAIGLLWDNKGKHWVQGSLEIHACLNSVFVLESGVGEALGTLVQRSKETQEKLTCCFISQKNIKRSSCSSSRNSHFGSLR